MALDVENYELSLGRLFDIWLYYILAFINVNLNTRFNLNNKDEEKVF